MSTPQLSFSSSVSVLVFFLVFLSFSVSCFGENKEGYSTSDSNLESNQFEGFGIFLSTNKSTYGIGEPIVIKLKVFNYSNKSIILHFRSSQRFDFSILKGKEEIWRWSKDKFFAQVLGEVALEPGKIIVYEEKFEGKLEAGYYKVIGSIIAENRPLTATLTIAIKGE